MLRTTAVTDEEGHVLDDGNGRDLDLPTEVLFKMCFVTMVQQAAAIELTEVAWSNMPQLREMKRADKQPSP